MYLKKESGMTFEKKYKRELLEVKKELYLQTRNIARRKDAIKAMDILENMSTKSIHDKKTEEKLQHIFALMRVK